MRSLNTYEASSSEGASQHDTCGITSAKIRWTCCQCGTLNKHPWEYCTGCGKQICDDCFDQKIASDHNLTMSLPKHDLFGETNLTLMWVCCQCSFLNQHPREYCTRCKITICDACLSQKGISDYDPTMDLLRGTQHQISSSHNPTNVGPSHQSSLSMATLSPTAHTPQDPHDFWGCCCCGATNYPPDSACTDCRHRLCRRCYMEGL